MKKFLTLVTGLLMSAGTYAETLDTRLQHFEGMYRLVSAKNGDQWNGVECPGPQITVRQGVEYGALVINMYKTDIDGNEHWLDPDQFSFRAIGSKKSGGGVWDGITRLTGSYECSLLEDGSIRRLQQIRSYALGIAPTGSSSMVAKLQEKNGMLTYRRLIDQDLIIECVYKK